MKFQQTTLANGLEIIAETNEAAYSASIGFFVKTGARDETSDLAGVSHFLEHMVFKGTDRRSAWDVNRQLDEMGADANAFTTEELTVYYASLLPELAENAVELLGDILRPALREDDFETEKQVILEEIAMYEDQPPFGADEKSREYFFEDHPLGNAVLGCRDSITGLTADRMRNYFESRYRPENIVLAAAGRIDFDRFVDRASAICGPWTDFERSDRTADVPFHRVRGCRGAHRIVKPSAVQQHTILLFDAPGGLDEDRFAAGILANMIGDDVGSRMYWELVDSGIADYAGMGTCEFLDNGLFSVGLSSEPEYADEVLRKAREICETMMRRGPTQDELDRSKNKVLSRLVLANERPSGRLFAVGGEWVVRHEYRTVRHDLDDIEKLTLNDIFAVLEKYPLDDPFLMTVGPMEG